MAFDVNRFIAGQANTLGDVTSQLGRQGEDFQTLPAIFKDKIYVHHCRQKIFKQSIIGTGLIWGSETFGIWGLGSWIDSQITSSFILGSDEYGKLDINYLGDRSVSAELYSVHNDADLFLESFDNNRFIDETLSTGSFYSQNYYEIPNLGYFYTDYIAKENKIYKRISINNLEAEYSDGSDATSDLGVCAIINSVEYPLTIGTETEILNTSNDGLKLKFFSLNNGTEFGETGLTFPISFSTVNPIRLKYYECKYYDN